MPRMIIGHIERANAERCSGWALDSDDRGRGLTVRIVINGRVCAEVPADIKRADVLKTRGRLESGFSVPIGDFLIQGKNRLQVLAGSGRSFREIGGAVVDTRRPGDFVEEGRDGWLFLQNDSNDVVAALTGQQPLPPALLATTAETLRRRRAFCAARGVRTLTYVVPDKGVVLNHLRREALALSDRRPAVQIAEAAGPLEQSCYHYALADLMAHPERDALYWQTDTHLSDLGSVTAFERMMELLGRPLELTWRPPQEEELHGDLGSKLRPRRTESVRRRRPVYHTLELIDEISVILARGGVLREKRLYHRSARNDGSRIAIFGTSTAYQMRELFFASFEHVHLYWRNRVDLGVVLAPRPDVLLSVAHERFLGTGLRDDKDRVVPLVPRLVVPRRAQRLWGRLRDRLRPGSKARG